MAGAWDILETSIVPSLPANCGSWVGIGKEIYHSLNKLWIKYWRSIYSCLPSTSLIALRTQAGMLNMQKCINVYKGVSGDKDTAHLCRKVLKVQLAMGWPHIIIEVNDRCHTSDL